MFAQFFSNAFQEAIVYLLLVRLWWQWCSICSEVKASSAKFNWNILQGCRGAAAEISFAAHMVEGAEVPAVSAEASSRLEGTCG